MIEVEHVSAATPEIRALIEELDGELSRHYAAAQRHGLSLDAIFQPHLRFFVARINGDAAGCGGVALFAGFAELKRMYVRPEHRGRSRGVADALIARLETEALDAGLTVMHLETGAQQAAAIRFYARNGYRECRAFEPYCSMPAHAIATSVFMEKRIGSEPRRLD